MGGPADGTKLIRSLKTDLIDTLREDPDFVLQHCHSLNILSNNEYNNIKDINNRSKQVRNILDYVIHKGNKSALEFLRLLRRQDMQDTFPKLEVLQDLSINKRKAPKSIETTAKRKTELENNVLSEQPCMTNSRMVTEKEMMKVARCIGNSWREVGIMALEMSTTTLQQIEEDNKLHTERVFAMLRRWSMRERDGATAFCLYNLLTQEENGVDPRKINFLLENN